MSPFNFFLSIHILAGVVCLMSGMVAAFAKKRRGIHTWAGEIYHGFYVIVFITAIIVSIMHWEQSAYLFFIALFSYGFAITGYLARKIRWKRWLRHHISGMLGSYIGIVTATLVVNAASIPLLNQLPILLVWFLPTIVGTPIITLTVRRLVKGKQTKTI